MTGNANLLVGLAKWESEPTTRLAKRHANASKIGSIVSRIDESNIKIALYGRISGRGSKAMLQSVYQQIHDPPPTCPYRTFSLCKAGKPARVGELSKVFAVVRDEIGKSRLRKTVRSPCSMDPVTGPRAVQSPVRAEVCPVDHGTQACEDDAGIQGFAKLQVAGRGSEKMNDHSYGSHANDIELHCELHKT